MLRAGSGEGLGTIRRHVLRVNIANKIAELGFNTTDIKFRPSLGKSNDQSFSSVLNLRNILLSKTVEGEIEL